MMQYVDAPELVDTPVVVDLVDVDSQKWFDYAAASRGLRRWLYRVEGRRLRRLERSLPARCRAVTLVSEAEADIYRRFCPNDRTHSISNGVDLDYFTPSGDEGRSDRCVFVGALDYRANVDGLRWFCREVWPQLHRRRPQATFAIVGRNPAADVQTLARLPGVEVIASPPDVRPHLRDAQVVVAPLQIARGIQNKVLEAMAMAKPVVATPGALEGLDVDAARDVLEAAAPADWLAALESLFGDEEKRRRIGRRARQFVERHHSWPAQLAPLGELLGLDSNIRTPYHTSAAPRRPEVVEAL